MRVNSIAAVGPKGQLGLNGTVPWFGALGDDLRAQTEADLAVFKRLTEGSDLIAGYHTYHDILRHISHEKLLTTGRRLFLYDNRTQTPEQLLAVLAADGYPRPPRDVWIVGGAQTYKAFAHLITGVSLVSVITHYDGPADTYYPDYLLPHAPKGKPASNVLEVTWEETYDNRDGKAAEWFKNHNRLMQQWGLTVAGSGEMKPLALSDVKIPLSLLPTRITPPDFSSLNISVESDVPADEQGHVRQVIQNWQKIFTSYQEARPEDDGGYVYFNKEEENGTLTPCRAWPVGVEVAEDGINLVHQLVYEPLPEETTLTRELDQHKTNPANNELTVKVTDKPGAGGANHRYEVTGADFANNPSWEGSTETDTIVILFQNGPIPEHGVNGLTQEVLLAIVIDRLESFQAGPFASDYNAVALEHSKAALASLKQRTLDRMARGVEGTHQK